MAPPGGAGNGTASRRLALAVPIDGLGFRESLGLAAGAERLGYTDLWSYEVAGSDGFSPLGWLAARTERARLGISLVPAFTRPAALLAMSCAALQGMSGGRFVLGLGSSSPTVVENWMGLTHDRPVTRVRETVEALRLILSGEKTAYDGATLSVRDFRLGLGPAPTPVMLGALGPRMFALAGEIGDGVITVFNAATRTPALLADLRAAAVDAGRDPAQLEVVTKLFVAVDEEGPEIETTLRRLLVGYGTVPAYNELLRRQGFAAEATAIADAWAAGDRLAALAAVTTELLHKLFIFGPAEACASQLEAFAAAGVTTPLISPISGHTDATRLKRSVVATVELAADVLAPSALSRR
jgi:probable F420-dependent oxidoreductase